MDKNDTVLPKINLNKNQQIESPFLSGINLYFAQLNSRVFPIPVARFSFNSEAFLFSSGASAIAKMADVCAKKGERAFTLISQRPHHVELSKFAEK